MTRATPRIAATRLALAAALVLSLGACREDETASLPAPVTMNPDALGHYCQMNLLEHPGPKAQIHLEGVPAPLFFSQVRDAIAYQRMPEQSHLIVVTYVNDMATAESWDAPGADNWINAADALYVIGSDAVGGMQAPELVPFSTRPAAEAFTARHGGTITTLQEIPDSEVLTPVDLTPPPATDGKAAPGDDTDYLERLRTLSQERQG